MNAKKLFGTDGIRGRVGQFPLNSKVLSAIAKAASQWFGRKNSGPFLIAIDTRSSGIWISKIIRSKFQEKGIEVKYAGFLTTPAAVWAVQKQKCCGGVIISASHNPAHDNGLKFLNDSGCKLSNDAEDWIEEKVWKIIGEKNNFNNDNLQDEKIKFDIEENINTKIIDIYCKDLMSKYRNLSFLNDFTVSFDCANGAASFIVPYIFNILNIKVGIHHANPDGENINRACGSVHPNVIKNIVIKNKSTIGFALDGDGDRLIACTPSGMILDGDRLLWIFSSYFLEQNELKPPVVVGTIMTNLGLEEALAKKGIKLIRTPVGDRNIQAEMLKNDYKLGGEPSGHLIVSRFGITGDGIAAAILLMEVLSVSRKPITRLLQGYTPYPNKIFNIPCKKKIPLESIPLIKKIETTIKTAGKSKTRCVVRYSGTEPLLRIMIEAKNIENLIERTLPLIEELKVALNKF